MKLTSLDDLLAPIKAGDYGPVKIVGGEHAGQLGNYDDEADDEGVAIVYLHGTTIADEHPHIAEIKHTDLRKSDVIDPFSRDRWYAMHDRLQRLVWAHDGNVEHSQWCVRAAEQRCPPPGHAAAGRTG